MKWTMVLLALGLAACDAAVRRDNAHTAPVERDLDVIRQDTLRIGVLEDAATYEVRTNGPAGAEWALLAAFTEHLGLPYTIVPVDSLAHGHEALRCGDIDVLAAQLGPHHADSIVLHVLPYADVAPTMVFRRPADARHRAVIDSVFVPENSAFGPLEEGVEECFNGIAVHRPRATAAALLDAVVVGRCDGVVLPEHAAVRALEQYPLLGALHWSKEREPIGIGMRANAPALQRAWRAFIDDGVGAGVVRQEVKTGRFRERTGPFAVGRIRVDEALRASFDPLFARVADSVGADRHLLMAIAFRESGFDTTADSHMGAQGIMQLMPATAEKFGGGANDVEGQVRAAAVYLRRLDEVWRSSVPERAQRERFILASYNAGDGHIQDAQRLARRLGLRPDRWENHVERALLLLSSPRHWRKPYIRNGFCKGSETFRFVRNVIGTWDHFSTTVEEDIAPPDTTGVALPMDTMPDPVGTPVSIDTVLPVPEVDG